MARVAGPEMRITAMAARPAPLAGATMVSFVATIVGVIALF
jgi:hypothetical protein